MAKSPKLSKKQQDKKHQVKNHNAGQTNRVKIKSWEK